jgi:superfamily II DNA or RNA helicase
VSFLELELKPDYDSGSDDILHQFYVPVLSRAKRYNRLAGFFSSSSLAVAARGISAFIENKGSMKIIVGARLQKSDVEAIKEGKEDPDKIISEIMLGDLKEIEDEVIRDHVRALAWLVAKGHLDVKVALVVDNSGQPMDFDAAMRRGIFHQKVGIFEDENGNFISFSGSVNETASAWEDNIEEFKVFRSWVEGEVEHLASDNRKFEKYWYGQTDRLRVYDIPTAVRDRLIELTPDDVRSLRIAHVDEKPALREYQNEAISRWLENSGRGIFEMATATGKTYTALGCLVELLKKEHRLVVVITCPFTHLIRQWRDNLKIFGFRCLEAFAGSATWEDRLANAIFDFNNGSMSVLVVVTTHDTFASERFMQAVNSVSGKIFLIADEVHGLGSPERQKGLIESYRFRLGLSATPTRWFDEEGTVVILNFFEKTVFEFPLDKAIASGFLCKYEYHPYIVELAPYEMEEYKRLTKKIALEYSKTKDNLRKSELLNLYSIIRQRVIVNASEKYVAFNQILDVLDEPSHCLVYCSPQQIDSVQEILNKRGIVQHKFTAQEDAKERTRLLNSFAEGRYKVLVAMRCLDEGVDVPSTRIAIIMASSTNPREFIQRRGRILRLSEGKNKAVIYDIIVVPTIWGSIDPEFYELEAKIMKGELRRYTEFARSATNSGLAYAKIAGLASKYHITLEG